jgi:phosphosulfolactate synthase
LIPSGSTHAFDDLVIARRGDKPRDTGLTMMIDWGIPVREQQGILAIAGSYVDLAKVAVGLSTIITRDALGEKLTSYAEADIGAFPGGMLLELAVAQDMLDEYLAETAQLGYPIVEVSDNVVKLPPTLKAEAIRAAADQHGLKVLGEVGSKHVKTNPTQLIDEAQDCLDAGAWKVLIEAAELYDDQRFNRELALDLGRAVPVADLIFELPGTWIRGIHTHGIHSTTCWLIEHFGPDVNIGNVAVDAVLALETLRTGTGVTMAFEPTVSEAPTPRAARAGSAS